MQTAIAIMALVGLSAFANTANASTACASIDNDSERLTCYDRQYRDVEPQSGQASIPTIDQFRELVEYSGDLGWNQIYMHDCKLYEIAAMKPRTSAGQVQAYRTYVWQLLLDLSKVETDKVESQRGRIKIVAQRDVELFWSQLGLQHHQGKEIILREPENIAPGIWHELLSDETKTKSLVGATDRMGNYGPFTVNATRSVEWNFARFFPEDSKAVEAAFLELVQECQ